MGNCKDCKHWDTHGKGHGICVSIADETEGSNAYVRNYDYEATFLVTLPDFGCVLFEQKERE